MEGDSEMPSGVDNRNLVDSNSKAQGITREQIEGVFVFVYFLPIF